MVTSAVLQKISRWFLPLVFGIAFIACPGEALISPTSRPLQNTGVRESDRLSRLEMELELVASKSLCSPEVRTLIRLMKHECGTTKCSAEDVRALFVEVEPHERFLWVMRDVPHVVIYLTEDFEHRPGSDAIVPQRQDQLRRLLQPPWLDFSQILIIGHGSTRETMSALKAHARAQKVKEIVLGLRFQGGLRIPAPRVWAFQYSFPLRIPTAKQLTSGLNQNEYLGVLELLNKNILLKKDLPIFDEPQQDPGQGVWVFLVDCLGQE